MPLFTAMRAQWGALLRRWILFIRLPDSVYYINGPETLPPPLSREEEKLVFEGLAAGDPGSRRSARASPDPLSGMSPPQRLSRTE